MNTTPHIVERETYCGATEVNTHASVALNLEADLAFHLMKQLSIIAAKEDGEDSAGRQRIRLLSPEEVAERSCAIAAAAVRKFEENGWMKEVPAPKPQKSKEEL